MFRGSSKIERENKGRGKIGRKVGKEKKKFLGCCISNDATISICLMSN